MAYVLPNVRLAYAEAYKIKDGGFRGVAKNILTGEICRGDVRDTLEQAKADSKGFVWHWADGRNMVTGTFRSPKGLQWRMNYFIRADEAGAN